MTVSFSVCYASFIGHGMFVTDDFGNLVYLWGEPAYRWRHFFLSTRPDYYGQ